jgi:hypothetical protein
MVGRMGPEWTDGRGPIETAVGPDSGTPAGCRQFRKWNFASPYRMGNALIFNHLVDSSGRA